jgi:hypothetical protein
VPLVVCQRQFRGVHDPHTVNGPHGGNGLNEVLEITSIVDALHLKQSLDADHLKVRFVSRSKIGPLHKISVDKVSLYRQGAQRVSRRGEVIE